MSGGAKHFYEFGPFRLDATERQLLRGSEVLPLTPKLFDILLVLVENGGHILEKEELMKAVWPDSVVEEGNLTRNVSTLRKALGKSPDEQQYIETIPWRGYRFTASVREISDGDAELIIEEHSRARIVIEDQQALGVAPEAPPYRTSWWWSRGALVGATMLLLVISFGGGLVLQRFRLRRTTTAAPFSLDDYGWQKLSSDDKSGTVLISPDGQSIVYLEFEGPVVSMKTRRLASSETLTIVPLITSACWGMTLTHDGSFVYYTLADDNGATGTLYKVSVLGGSPRKIVEHINTKASLSPDDSRVAFMRYGFKPGVSALMTANANDGSDERVLESSDSGPSLYNPEWSPDGPRIVCFLREKTSEGSLWSLVEISAHDGGRVNPITPPIKQHIWGYAWLQDRSGLVMIATDRVTNLAQLYLVSYPDGTMRRITNDLYVYSGLSISADGSKLVTNQTERQTNIWLTAEDDLKQTSKITTQACCTDGLAWTPDGRIVFDAVAGGKRQLWIMNADGSNQERLSPNGAMDWSPSVSPNGQIVFLSIRSGSKQIWCMDIDGRNPRQLTRASNDLSQPGISPDGLTVYFTEQKNAIRVLMRVSLDGGEPRQLTDGPIDLWDIARDGKKLAYSFWDESLGRQRVIVRGLEDNAPKTYFEVAPNDFLRWTADGGGLVFNNMITKDPGANSNLFTSVWQQPLSDGAPELLISSQPDTIYWVDWSRTGKRLALVRGKIVSNIVMLSRLQGAGVTALLKKAEPATEAQSHRERQIGIDRKRQ